MDIPYIKKNVGDALSMAITSYLVHQPKDPIDYVARHLLQLEQVQKWIEEQRERVRIRQKLLASVNLRRNEARERAKDLELLERQHRMGMFRVILDEAILIARMKWPQYDHDPEVDKGSSAAASAAAAATAAAGATVATGAVTGAAGGEASSGDSNSSNANTGGGGQSKSSSRPAKVDKLDNVEEENEVAEEEDMDEIPEESEPSDDGDEGNEEAKE